MSDEKRSDRFTLSSVNGFKIERAADFATREAKFVSQAVGTARGHVLVAGGGKRVTASSGPAEKKWRVVDAEGLVIGRAATIIADILRGKDKPNFTPYIDCGDKVIVINADKVRLAGRGLVHRVYYRAMGYDSVKEAKAQKAIESRFPERQLEKAVERMIPRGPLGRQQLRNLRIYKGAAYPGLEESAETLDPAIALPKK